MEQSDNIKDLAFALNKAQKEDLFALTDKTNPFFKSKYADLSSVWQVARKPLTENGLSVVQTMDESANGHPVVVTTLMHESGQWIRGRLTLKPTKEDPQAIGSAITYGRRYSLSAILGICPEDDDAEGGMDRTAKKAPKRQPKAAPKKAPKETPDFHPDKEAITRPQQNKLFAMMTDGGYDKKESKELYDWHLGKGDPTKAWGTKFIEKFDDIARDFVDHKIDSGEEIDA